MNYWLVTLHRVECSSGNFHPWQTLKMNPYSIVPCLVLQEISNFYSAF